MEEYSGILAEIQAGNREKLPELWEAVAGFVVRQASRRMTAQRMSGSPCPADLDDLVQEGFFAMLQAAESYRPGGRMSFIGWLDLYLKTAFNKALGIRRVRESMLRAVSLAQPLGEQGGDTLGDMIPDTWDCIGAAERDVWREQLRDAVNVQLEELPEDWRRILRLRFWQEQGVQQIAAEVGMSHQAVSAKTVRALRRLRKCDAAGKLAEFAQQM